MKSSRFLIEVLWYRSEGIPKHLKTQASGWISNRKGKEGGYWSANAPVARSRFFFFFPFPRTR